MLTTKTGRDRVRELVRMRDGYACQSCDAFRTPDMAKAAGKRLFDVHHTNGMCGKRSKGYDRISEMDGLITLCHKCHFNQHDWNPEPLKSLPERGAKYVRLFPTEPKPPRVRLPRPPRQPSPRKLEILARFKAGATQSALAKEFGVSRQRINQIVRYEITTL